MLTTKENIPPYSVIVHIDLSQASHHFELIISTICLNLLIIVSGLQRYKLIMRKHEHSSIFEKRSSYQYDNEYSRLYHSKREKGKRKMDHILFHIYPNTRERKSNSAYREGETIGNFENATNIQPKKLSCDHSLRKFLAVFNNFQNNLPCKKKIESGS